MVEDSLGAYLLVVTVVFFRIYWISYGLKVFGDVVLSCRFGDATYSLNGARDYVSVVLRI